MLAIRELRKTYPAQGGPMAALDGVGFTVEAGTFVSVIGPSGAGKSTLLRCVTGQLRPDGGSILLDGADMVPLRGRQKRRLQQRIGMIYQDFCLVGCATAEENVLNACLPELGPLSVLLGRFPREKRQAARTLLATVGLAGKEDQRADSLSGGEQQRVAVARALMQGGTLLLADEPVASLDPVRAEEVLELLRRLQREQGLSVLMNSHNVDQALRYSDRILGLRQGRVVFDGPPAAVTEAVLKDIYGGEAAHEAV
ncbi:MAG: phosphonate ABC transporter ATP-binding protein [Dysosmobacter sp.]|nr:phosphonate ABC transporter ATP-binding protein [Dysosmobacter sp.]